MKIMALAVGLFLATHLAFAQTGNCNQQVSRTCSDSQTIMVSGHSITIPSNGGLVPSFEVVIQGSVAPVSLTVVINGCATSGTCDVLDTYTTVANSLRAPTVSKVYDHYTVSATWTGGTGVAIKINTQITSARLEPPTSLPPSGPAGGDLSGNFPNPTVAKVNGGVIPVSKSVVGTNSLGQVIDATSVLSNYLPLSGGAGYPLTGPLTLSGNATLPLQAVPLQQVQASSTSGNAATATALAATPTQCSGGTPLATGIAANGNANCTSAPAAGVTSFNTRTGAVTLTATDVNGVGTITNSTSGNAATATNVPWSGLTGTAPAISTFSAGAIANGSTATTQTTSDTSTDVATDAFVHNVAGGYLPLSAGSGYPLTGPLTLSGNASSALQAVPLQQVTPLAATIIPSSVSNLVTVGDSLCTNYGPSQSGGVAWITNLASMPVANGATAYNYCGNGWTLATTVAAYPTGAHTVSPSVTGKPGILFIENFANDVPYIQTPGGSCVSSCTYASMAAYETAVQSFITTGLSDGYKVAFLYYPEQGGSHATYDQYRIPFNMWLGSNATINYLIDQRQLMSNPYDGTWYTADNLHPTAIASVKIASLVAQTIYGGGLPPLNGTLNNMESSEGAPVIRALNSSYGMAVNNAYPSGQSSTRWIDPYNTSNWMECGVGNSGASFMANEAFCNVQEGSWALNKSGNSSPTLYTNFSTMYSYLPFLVETAGSSGYAWVAGFGQRDYVADPHYLGIFDDVTNNAYEIRGYDQYHTGADDQGIKLNPNHGGYSGNYPFVSANGKNLMLADGTQADGNTIASTTPSFIAIGASTLYSAAGTALPTCGSSIKGERAVVSDATSPTYMGAYTSGGGITAEVICSYNGTTYAWLTH